ncbi:MAG: B12-binding domain-containing radical SAM protein [Sulfuritalea sp.]|jgi:radical SAM superfamily enzyme YgiQ (UPF0313 family)|nr:B12-binding domain-containing radical SAM protein [Sulfuritalea sp.]
MTRIAFVNPLSLPFDILKTYVGGRATDVRNITHEGVTLPMGIMYLSSYLKQHLPDITVTLIDYRRHFAELPEYGDLEAFIDTIAIQSSSEPPDIIAFSVIVPSSHAFFKLSLDRLSRLWPNAEVIVGGGYATNYAAELIEFDAVDAVFRGEGELSLITYLSCQSEDQKNVIPGVIVKSNRNYRPYSMPAILPTMDFNPLPDYELVDMRFYVENNSQMGVAAKSRKYSGVKSASLMTSLGCPFRCTFCASHTIHGRKLRYKSIPHVIDEIKLLNEKWGVTFFLPNDDLFVASKKRTLALLAAIRELDISNFTLQCPASLSVNILDEEIIDALIDTGMDVITISIESGSEHVQKNIIKKSVKLDKAKRLVAHIRSREVDVRAVFILGFPGETLEQMNETIAFALELGADWNLFFVATPIPGSEMFEQFATLGYIPQNIDSLTDSHFAKRGFDTPEASATEVTDLVYGANLITNFSKNINIRAGRWHRAIEFIEPIAEQYPFHLIALDALSQCYGGTGDYDGVASCDERIRRAYSTDQRAHLLFDTYGHLLSPRCQSEVRRIATDC